MGAPDHHNLERPGWAGRTLPVFDCTTKSSCIWGSRSHSSPPHFAAKTQSTWKINPFDRIPAVTYAWTPTLLGYGHAGQSIQARCYCCCRGFGFLPTHWGWQTESGLERRQSLQAYRRAKRFKFTRLMAFTSLWIPTDCRRLRPQLQVLKRMTSAWCNKPSLWQAFFLSQKTGRPESMWTSFNTPVMTLESMRFGSKRGTSIIRLCVTVLNHVNGKYRTKASRGRHNCANSGMITLTAMIPWELQLYIPRTGSCSWSLFKDPVTTQERSSIHLQLQVCTARKWNLQRPLSLSPQESIYCSLVVWAAFAFQCHAQFGQMMLKLTLALSYWRTMVCFSASMQKTCHLHMTRQHSWPGHHHPFNHVKRSLTSLCMWKRPLLKRLKKNNT